ncbi:2-amino-4-hydroxy-6-hydroxymethyldihydropteridinediphosphokinase [Helicobacter felis]|uniref:2-amino-4-hydroxy-6-hydroxymethyldihydropteridine pyrophosphokinase n=1 Tax=Helicobacter felis (strain ATCC 49179 / CCUG 28539 / NCTC 12436 / CS1) TaxID=936155 RepID=E7AA95_HELFC|nr:putative 2-amino-4-hydroxy-6-hydroxymethyldihydropteridine pyrophosphokinase [Helicobacter felis ATCC 49179]
MECASKTLWWCKILKPQCYEDRGKLVYTSCFPGWCGRSHAFKNAVTLGIGSNVGDSKKVFRALWGWLARHRLVSRLCSSPLYINPAFGYTNQRDFTNATLSFQTPLSVGQLFSMLFYLERRWGRERKRPFKNAPRTLDIDLLFFNRMVYRQDYLTLPHPQWNQRASVLIPLSLQHAIWGPA